MKNFVDYVDILDNKRVPINSNEREKIKGDIPYYGATGQVDSINNYLFDEELVLLGEDGAPFMDSYKDKAYLINGKSWVNNHAHVLRGKNGLLNKFLLYWLNIIDYKEYVTGTTRLKLNQARMKNIKIPFPKTGEQKLIVEEIEKQLTRLEETSGSLKQTKQKLGIYKKAILKSTFDKVFDRKDLIQLCDKITQGPNPKLKDYAGTPGNYVLKTKDFYNYNVLYEKCDLIGKELVQEWKNFILKDGDVIIGLVGVGSIGKINVFREQPNKNYLFTRATGLIRPKKGVADPEYIHYFFLSSKGSKLIEKGIGGSTGQLVIKTSYLKGLEIPAPSFTEQQKIAQSIEDKLLVIDKIEQNINLSLVKASSLKRSILKSAFEGKLVNLVAI